MRTLDRAEQYPEVTAAMRRDAESKDSTPSIAVPALGNCAETYKIHWRRCMNRVAENLTEIVKSNITKRERFHFQRTLVQKIVETYQLVKDLPALGGRDYDPMPSSRSRRWTPDSCHYAVDVEHAINRVLDKMPDASDMRNAWERLLTDITVIGKHEKRLIELLAPIFAARKLDPADYFRPRRLGSPVGKTA